MNNLQDKPIIVGNPIEVEKAINQIRLVLDSNLNWLSHPYFIAEKFYKKTESKTFVYPETYCKDLNVDAKKKKPYHRLTPDNDYSGMCFFIVGDGINDFEPYQHNYITYEVGLIFSVNLELIDQEKLEQGLFTQELIRDVRRVLTDNAQNDESFSLKIKTETRDLKKCYREFVLEDLQNYNRAPLQCFRFNLQITIHEQCGELSGGDSACGTLQNFESFTIQNQDNFFKTITFTGGNTNGSTEVTLEIEGGFFPLQITLQPGSNTFDAGLNFGNYTMRWRKICGSVTTEYNEGTFEIINEGTFNIRLATVEPFNDNNVQFPVEVAQITTIPNQSDQTQRSGQIANDENEYVSIFNQINSQLGTLQNPQFFDTPSIKYWGFEIVMNDYTRRPSQAWSYIPEE